MSRQSPPARARLVTQVAYALKSLFEYDHAHDAKDGSPDADLTAFVQILQVALTFSRVGIAHKRPDIDFEQVLSAAREREAEDWKRHRAQCPDCGGH